MKSVLLAIAVLAISASNAQVKLPEFGQIDEKTLNLKSCPFEPGAEAMVLFDHTKVALNDDRWAYRVVTERRVRIKVFNENGFKHANITIPYINRRRENRIKDISAFTYSIGDDGKTVIQKIEKSQIFKNKPEDDIKTISFAFPNVKPGSVVEYRYTQVEINSAQPWLVQRDIPIENTICEWELPINIPFSYLELYQLPIVKSDTTREKYWGPIREVKFLGTNIPSFKQEPFMSSIRDNIQRVQFAISKWAIAKGTSATTINHRWGLVNEELMNSAYFGKLITGNISGTASLIDTARKLKKKEEKIKYLFESVRNHVKWDRGYSFGAENLSQCWSEKLGNTGEINLILLNLLKKAGVNAVPLLVSTRRNGKVNKEFINIGQFNSLVIWIPDSTQSFILDAARKYASYKTTPFEILNRDAFAIDSAIGQWVYIADPRPLHRQVINVLATIDSTEKLSGEAAVFLFDYAKEDELKTREKEKDEEEENKKLKVLTISDYSEQDATDSDKPMIQKFKFNYETTQTNDLYHFNPIFISALKENPFTAQTRQTDVDLGSNQLINFTVIVMLSENYKVEFLPGSIWLRNQDSTISFQRFVALEPKRAVMKFILEINKPIIPKEEYPELRDFYKKLFALLNEQVVLKKVN